MSILPIFFATGIAFTGLPKATAVMNIDESHLACGMLNIESHWVTDSLMSALPDCRYCHSEHVLALGKLIDA